MSKELVVFGCSMPSNYVRYMNELNEQNKELHGKPWESRHWDPTKKTLITRSWDYMEEFPTFDIHMSDYFNLIPKNYAYPGSGNLSIFNKASDYISLNHEKIGCAIVCWTQLARMGFLERKYETFNDGTYFSTENEHRRYQTIIFGEYEPKEDSKTWKVHNDGAFFRILQSLFKLNNISVEHDVDTFLRQIYILQSMCDLLDVPLIQCTSIPDYPKDERIIKSFITNKTYHMIDRSRFYGYPLNDLTATEFLCNYYKPKFRLNEADKHPSALQHEKMAEKLIDFSVSKGIMSPGG